MILRYTVSILLRNPILRLLIICLISSSCLSEKSGSINEIEFSDSTEVVQLKNWQFLGPFSQDSTLKQNVMDVDFLYLRGGGKESEITANDLLAIATSDQALKSGLIEAKAQGINILDSLDKQEGVVYLFCEIQNNTDEEVNFLFSGMQHAKLWLNGEPVYETLWKRVQYKYYEEYVPVELKKGSNFLLLKLIYSDTESASHWKFNFFVSRGKYARDNYLKDYKFSILAKSIADSNLQAYLGPFINEDISYKIYDNDSNIVTQKAIDKRKDGCGMAYVDLSSLERNDLYNIEFDIAGEKLAQDFYYGEFDTVFDRISEQYKTNLSGPISEKCKLELQASYERLQFLMTRNNDPELPTSVRAYWDRSRVLFAKELTDFFKVRHKVGDHRDQFNGTITTYASKIDDSKQYYSSYIPENLQQGNRKIPLILLCPFSYTPTPYLESWYTSNRDQDLWDSKLADEFGFGLVWLDLRGYPGLNEIAMTAFQEILADLKTKYNVDENRIYILGNSSSSRKALTIATRFPSLIAGSIFYGPDVDVVKFKADKYRIENLSNGYLFVQHSINDEIMPLETVERIYQRMQAYSRNPIFKIVEHSTHFVTPKDSYRSAFEYLKDKKRNMSPDSIIVSTNELKYGESYGLQIMEKLKDSLARVKVYFEKDTVRMESENVNHFEVDLDGRNDYLPIVLNGRQLKNPTKINGKIDVVIDSKEEKFPFRKNNLVEGPINHAFAGKFKVVFTEGSRAIKDTLNTLWQNMYFNDVLSVTETDLTREDVEKSNLVLIGTKFRNRMIQNIVEQLPLQINKDHIIFRGERINGKDVLVSFVYPNPLNPDRYVVLLASNSLIKSMPIRDLSNEGESDFMIFHYKGDGYQLTSSGNFDNDWR